LNQPTNTLSAMYWSRPKYWYF